MVVEHVDIDRRADSGVCCAPGGTPDEAGGSGCIWAVLRKVICDSKNLDYSEIGNNFLYQ